MNREIKFRVWDKTYKEMLYDGECMLSANGVLYLNYDIGKIKAFGSNEGVVMMATDLKDKNGLDIYEGDLVRWNKKKPKDVMMVKITKAYPSALCDSVCLVSLTHDYCKNEDEEVPHGIQRLKDVWSHDFQLEVIGNIFENPELFK